MRDKCLSLISMFRAVSFLDFNSDLKTQIAFTESGERLLRVLVFTLVKMENTLSASAFEFGSALTALKRDFRLGCISIHLEFLRCNISFHTLQNCNFVSVLLLNVMVMIAILSLMHLHQSRQ